MLGVVDLERTRYTMLGKSVSANFTDRSKKIFTLVLDGRGGIRSSTVARTLTGSELSIVYNHLL